MIRWAELRLEGQAGVSERAANASTSWWGKEVHEDLFWCFPCGDHGLLEQVIAPTGRCLDFPPESYSFQFNEEGKCVKMTGGFVMDAQQGKSEGLGGELSNQTL